jgi:hypothetical protein
MAEKSGKRFPENFIRQRDDASTSIEALTA